MVVVRSSYWPKYACTIRVPFYCYCTILRRFSLHTNPPHLPAPRLKSLTDFLNYLNISNAFQCRAGVEERGLGCLWKDTKNRFKSTNEINVQNAAQFVNGKLSYTLRYQYFPIYSQKKKAEKKTKNAFNPFMAPLKVIPENPTTQLPNYPTNPLPNPTTTTHDVWQ